MSAGTLAVDVLVSVAVAGVLLCCLGVLCARTAMDRLHYAAAATTLPPALVAAAVWVRVGPGQQATNATVVAVILLLLSPVLTVATGRALREREETPGTTVREPAEPEDAGP